MRIPGGSVFDGVGPIRKSRSLQELLALGPARLYLHRRGGRLVPIMSPPLPWARGGAVGPALPQVCWDPGAAPASPGVGDPWEGAGRPGRPWRARWGGVRRAVELGFLTRGDFGLGVTTARR